MEIRKAKKSDIDSIEKIYEKIHDSEEKGLVTIGWIRTVYPTRKTAEDALNRNDLFVMVDEGNIVAAAVINQVQVDEYKYAAWKHRVKENEVMVLHALVVDPSEKNKGYGSAFVAYYEDYAKQHGCIALRMDTNARNTRARTLYQRLGYEEVGIVECVFNGIPNVQLVCLEKYFERGVALIFNIWRHYCEDKKDSAGFFRMSGRGLCPCKFRFRVLLYRKNG